MIYTSVYYVDSNDDRHDQEIFGGKHENNCKVAILVRSAMGKRFQLRTLRWPLWSNTHEVLSPDTIRFDPIKD
jgi:hypothetical protein